MRRFGSPAPKNRGSPSKSPRGTSAPPSSYSQIQIDDSAIQELVGIIDNVPSEQWNKRCNAFHDLVDSIPREPSDSATPTHWYQSSKTLRHLSNPIAALLRDSRSTVVKRTCESCALLFDKVGSDARHLLKDLMPHIMAVHAQTVQVIRTYVLQMVCEALPKVPCKAAMPLWLERLKSDRSKTVREASATYLSCGLENWRDEPRYLTPEIWNQVGALLMRSLRDPAPQVREQVKIGLEIFFASQPVLWDRLIRDPDGPVAKDPKLRRYLMKIASDEEINDELSVASRSSLASLASNRSGRAIPVSSVSAHGSGSFESTSSTPSPHYRQSRSLGPPVSRGPFTNHIHTNNNHHSPMDGSHHSTGRISHRSPMRSHGKSQNSRMRSQSPTSPSMRQSSIPTFNTPSSYRGRSVNRTPLYRMASPVQEVQEEQEEKKDLGTFNGTALDDVSETVDDETQQPEETPFLTGVSEALKQKNKQRRDRKAALMQERLGDLKLENGDGGNASGAVTGGGGDHVTIAKELLIAHKRSVDRLMEVIRFEMDALQEFESLVEKQAASEEQLLDYFESVGLCVDERKAIEKDLEEAMERISSGTK